MPKISLQKYADNTVAAMYLHPLMTIQEALDKHGWGFVDKPTCCGAEVKMDGFLGSIYQAWCDSCGKFVADVTGPTFQNGGGCVTVVDSDKVDVETDFEHRWISGVRQDGL